MRRLILAWLVSAGAFAAAAEPGLGGFVRYETRDFTLLTARSPLETRHTVEDLEKFRIVLEKTLGLKAQDTGAQTHIVILNNAQWNKYLRPSDGTAGWFQRTPFSNYLAINIDADHFGNPLQVIFHEYTHYFLRSQFAYDYPPWFNEGLAETMAYASFGPGSVARLEVPLERRIEAAIANWIPFERMLRVDADSPEYVAHQLGDSFYAQSWLTVHYGLYRDRKFGAQMFEYLSQINRMVPIEEAARSAFGSDLGEIDRKLKEYSHTLEIPVGTVDLGVVPRAELGTGRPMTEAGVLAELINLMLEVRIDASRIRPAVLALSAREPNSTRSAVLRARVAQLAGNDAELAEALNLAVQRLDPIDWESRRELGMVLLERTRPKVTQEPLPADTRQDCERALAWFGEALAQNPEDLESMWGYGTLATDLHSNFDLARKYLVAAYAKQPTNADLALALANLMGTTDHPEELVGYLKDVIRYETNVDTRKWATEALPKAEKYLLEKQKVDEENRRIEEENRKIEEENARRRARRKWFGGS